MKLALHKKLYSWAAYNLYGLFFLYAVAAILIAQDWIPKALSGNKMDYPGAAYGVYTIVMIIPVHTYWVAFLVMTPPLFYLTYLQQLVKTALYEEYRQHMPDALASQFGYSE